MEIKMLAAVYQNFTFQNPVITPAIIIWGIYAGFICAGIISVYNKSYLGSVVRALVSLGAVSPESAVPASKVCGARGRIKFRAVQNSNLSKFVKIANEEEAAVTGKSRSAAYRTLRRIFTGEKTDKLSFSQDKAMLYIPSDLRIRAELKYIKKGSSLPVIIVCAAVFLIVAIILTACIPYILNLIDSVISMYKEL